jgi:hypothetical protein
MDFRKIGWGGVWSGITWLRIGIIGACCECANEPSGSGATEFVILVLMNDPKTNLKHICLLPNVFYLHSQVENVVRLPACNKSNVIIWIFMNLIFAELGKYAKIS